MTVEDGQLQTRCQLSGRGLKCTRTLVAVKPGGQAGVQWITKRVADSAGNRPHSLGLDLNQRRNLAEKLVPRNITIVPGFGGWALVVGQAGLGPPGHTFGRAAM